MFHPDAHKLKIEFDEKVSRNPYLSREKIAKKMIDEREWKCGIVGFLTSFAGVATVGVTIILPFLIPLLIIITPLSIIISLLIDIILSTKMEVEIIYLLAYTYGYKPKDDRLELLTNYVLSRTNPKGEPLNRVVNLETPTDPGVNKKGIDGVLRVFVGFIKFILGKGENSQPNTKVGKMSAKMARKISIKVLVKSIRKLIERIFPIVGAITGYFLNIWSAKSTRRLALNWLKRVDEEL